jgi:hypothetical protein
MHASYDEFEVFFCFCAKNFFSASVWRGISQGFARRDTGHHALPVPARENYSRQEHGRIMLATSCQTDIQDLWGLISNWPRT